MNCKNCNRILGIKTDMDCEDPHKDLGWRFCPYCGHAIGQGIVKNVKFKKGDNGEITIEKEDLQINDCTSTDWSTCACGCDS